jgi:hypothetical protein
VVCGPAEAFTPEQLAELYDVNVLSTQRVNGAALPQLRRQGKGLVEEQEQGVISTAVISGSIRCAKKGVDFVFLHAGDRGSSMVDDATSQTQARMGEEETIWAVVGVLQAWIEKHGVPRSSTRIGRTYTNAKLRGASSWGERFR